LTRLWAADGSLNDRLREFYATLRCGRFWPRCGRPHRRRERCVIAVVRTTAIRPWESGHPVAGRTGL